MDPRGDISAAAKLRTDAFLVSEQLAHLEYIDEAIDGSAARSRRWSPFSQAIDLLDTIPGVNRRSAEVLIAECGPDMSRFGSPQRLASWAGICPGNNESTGKHFSGKTRRGSKWLRTALVESAQAAARTKHTYLAAQYARIKGRHGHNKAIVAVAHSILVSPTTYSNGGSRTPNSAAEGMHIGDSRTRRQQTRARVRSATRSSSGPSKRGA